MCDAYDKDGNRELDEAEFIKMVAELIDGTAMKKLPLAVRKPEFFKAPNEKYRPYHTLDFQRLGAFHRMPIRRPVPDPIVQNLATSEIAAEQPYMSVAVQPGSRSRLKS